MGEDDVAQEIQFSRVPSAARQTAHEYVRETLRQAILSGDVPGGTRLVQADLAEQLDVSTTPVREALRDLASEGLIQFDAHRGGIVHEISNEELQEVYDIRMLLEVEAMRRAAERITPEQIAKARVIHERMLADPESAAWVTLNRDFHLTTYEAADSPRLLAILRGLLDASVMYVSAASQKLPDHREGAGRDHEAILEALEAHDAHEACDQIAVHLNIPRSVLQLDD